MPVHPQRDYLQQRLTAAGQDEDQLLAIVRGFAWGRGWDMQEALPWYHVSCESHKLPAQGWKIHISATILSAPEVLRAVLPVLARERCTFKFAKTLKILAIMNESRYPREGSGKFITIYPDDEAQFKRMVFSCHEATRGMPGPRVMSDRQFAEAGVVHYRYGGFVGITRENETGRIEMCVRSPDGELQEDKRRAWYCPPDWAKDPFGESGGTVLAFPLGAAPQNPMDRLQIEKAIRHANKGGVYIGEWRDTGENIIMKEARPHVETLSDGRCAVDMLRNEAEILRVFNGDRLVPKLYDCFEWNGHHFLVEELIQGETLAARGKKNKESSDEYAQRVPCRQIALAVLQAMRHIHSQGICVRDISPNNIMICENNEVRFIDFEGAHRFDEVRPFPTVIGTPAYISADAQPGVLSRYDDMYSTGCVLYFIYTGDNPFYMPDDGAMGRRSHREKIGESLHILAQNNRMPAYAAEVIISLVNAKTRNYSWEQAIAALEKPDDPGICLALPLQTPFMEKAIAASITGYLAHKAAVADTTDQRDLMAIWPMSHAGDAVDYGVQKGISGIGYFLYDAWRMGIGSEWLLRETVRDVARRVAAWDGEDESAKGTAYGLYFGAYGAMLFMLEAAAALNETAIYQQTLALAEALPIKCDNPDLFHGAAGYGLASLHVWRHTRNDKFLQRAVTLADALCRQAAYREDGGVVWPSVFNGDGKKEKKIYYGFAHGVAGIGWYLLLMSRVTQNRQYLKLALAACRTLAAEATLYGDRARWLAGPDQGDGGAHMCNGAAGVGTFIIRAYAVTGDPELLLLAEQAGNTVVEAMHISSHCQCHGNAGDGEFLLDMAQFTGQEIYAKHAQMYSLWIQNQRVLKDGAWLLPDETTTSAYADHGTGFTGSACFLLRTVAGESRRWMLDDLLV